MIPRVFTLPFLAALAGLAVAAAVLSLLLGAFKGALWRRFESVPLALLGAVLARTFVSVVLGLGDDSRGVCLAAGWGLFLWPGLVDSVVLLFSDPVLTQPETLLWIATFVGGFAGMMDGLYRIHDFRGLGYLSFPLDVTWGLAGTTNGCLLHLINAVLGTHAPDTRTGVHRYSDGFCLKQNYAFTQGAVMSELPDAPHTPLFRHERLHAWQNRIFGPLFLLSYLSWAVLWFVPSLVAGGITGSFGQGPQEWCYLNNPWEAWAYALQGQTRSALNGMNARLVWPGWIVVVWGAVFFLAFTAAAVATIAALWT